MKPDLTKRERHRLALAAHFTVAVSRHVVERLERVLDELPGRGCVDGSWEYGLATQRLMRAAHEMYGEQRALRYVAGVKQGRPR